MFPLLSLWFNLRNERISSWLLPLKEYMRDCKEYKESVCIVMLLGLLCRSLFSKYLRLLMIAESSPELLVAASAPMNSVWFLLRMTEPFRSMGVRLPGISMVAPQPARGASPVSFLLLLSPEPSV